MLKRRLSFETATSTCCWPAPESRNSLVCGSRENRNSRSSSNMRWMAVESLSSSPRDLGSMANEMAGSASFTLGKTMGADLSPERVAGQRVLQLGHRANIARVEFRHGGLGFPLHHADVGEAFRRIRD